jgi:hypothetical protein
MSNKYKNISTEVFEFASKTKAKSGLHLDLPFINIEIEVSADKLYYIIYGSYNDMQNLKNNINNYLSSIKSKNFFTINKLNYPIARLAEDLEKLNKKKFTLGNSVETAQCVVCADVKQSKLTDLFSLVLIENNKIFYPYIILDKNCEPEKMIYLELKKLSNNNIPNYSFFVNNLKLVDIIDDSADNEFIVFSSRFNLDKKQIINSLDISNNKKINLSS